MLWTRLSLFALLLVVVRVATAQAGPLVVKARRDGVDAKVTLAAKSPRAGEEIGVTLTLHRHGADHASEPVTDATAQAHIAHGNDRTNVALPHDGDKPGSYAGSITFEHAGKETFHVGVTLPGKKKEWLIRVAVTVAKPSK